MNSKLSIIIPSYNEVANTIKTINNILERCENKNNIEIIVVNDNSNEDYSVLAKNNLIKYIKNSENLGTSKSRDVGIKLAESEYILTIDAHVSFYQKGWEKDFVEIIKNNPTSVLCFPCLDANKNRVYYAGGFYFFNTQNVELSLSPFLLNNEPNDEEVPCVIGGAYAFNRNWYDHLNGMSGMIGWGVGETFLSIKSYLAGGNCKLIKTIKMGHNFEKAKYIINKMDLYYNKLFITKTILPTEVYMVLSKFLPNNKEKEDAINLLTKNAKEIFQNRVAYEDILTVSCADYVKKFKLHLLFIYYLEEILI